MSSTPLTDANYWVLCEGRKRKILDDSQWADVQFVFNEKTTKQILKANKTYLAECSEVFYTMFVGSFQENNNLEVPNNITQIKIEDITCETFSDLLKFIYKQPIEFDMEHVFGLMYAAHKYEICSLETKCCQFLKSKLTSLNVCSIMRRVRLFNNQSIKDCLEFIANSTGDIIKSNGLLLLDKPTLIDIIKRDDLKVQEFELFKSVNEWILHNEIDDENDLLGIMKYIRFPLMTSAEFINCYKINSFIFLLKPKEMFDVHLCIITKVNNEELIFSQESRKYSNSSYSYR